MTIKPALMSVAEIESFLAKEFPQMHYGGQSYFTQKTGHGYAEMRLKAHERHLRPGGTISGPAMFALADVALYVAVLATIGPVGLAVTTNLNINFLSKPASGDDLIGTARLLKIGKRLCVGDVHIASATDPDLLVAQASGTYSIPPR